ncbi:prepilin-type N-terminal cleavage/methylation domain-containing protein [Desulfitispora alkaliphila]|uniref:type II secretion system protein n=1 Tax=Desulfitispora alkaliphila TaxID=622674 RepID=UPI003D1B439C
MRDKRGFTLFEVLAVVVVIGLLASMITPRVFNSVGVAKGNVCEGNIKMLEGILELYAIEHGEYPESSGDLKSSDMRDYCNSFPVCPCEEKAEAEGNGKWTGYVYNPETGEVKKEDSDTSGVVKFVNE